MFAKMLVAIFGISLMMTSSYAVYMPTPADEKIIDIIGNKLIEISYKKVGICKLNGLECQIVLDRIKQQNSGNLRINYIIDELKKFLLKAFEQETLLDFQKKNPRFKNLKIFHWSLAWDHGYGRNGGGFIVNLEDYLNPNHKNVVKYSKNGEYEVYTIDKISTNPPIKEKDPEKKASCDYAGVSYCINIVTKNGKIFFYNVPHEGSEDSLLYEGDKVIIDTIGSFYRFTKKGILFVDGLGYGKIQHLRFTYFNFEKEKLFYSLYTSGESGGKKFETLEFFDKPYGEERQPLDIKATSTEEAFYQYYK